MTAVERNRIMARKKKKSSSGGCLSVFLVLLLVCFAISVSVYIFIPVVVLTGIWKVYETLYFRGEKFTSIKTRIRSYIDDCNTLNHHVEELKVTHLGVDRLDAGRSDYQDESRWNSRRNALSDQEYAPNICNCSLTVCDGARKEPFKYVCKYFNISLEETTLEKFESVLNNFEAAEDGKASLQAEKENILKSIEEDVPALIRKFSKKKLEKSLGFEEINLSDVHFPRFTFKYVSPGGNKSTRYDVVMDIDNLNRFVQYLSEKIKFRKSVAGQRALMTSRLREKIKQRDNYTCKLCGISTHQEPHLLLEIDHIVPVSRGGLTAEDNLQTLCWRCNRSKGTRV